MRKFAGALIVALLALMVVSAAALFGIYRATQQAPSFYRRAMETAAAETEGGESPARRPNAAEACRSTHDPRTHQGEERVGTSSRSSAYRQR